VEWRATGGHGNADELDDDRQLAPELRSVTAIGAQYARPACDPEDRSRERAPAQLAPQPNRERGPGARAVGERAHAEHDVLTPGHTHEGQCRDAAACEREHKDHVASAVRIIPRIQRAPISSSPSPSTTHARPAPVPNSMCTDRGSTAPVLTR